MQILANVLVAISPEGQQADAPTGVVGVVQVAEILDTGEGFGDELLVSALQLQFFFNSNEEMALLDNTFSA